MYLTVPSMIPEIDAYAASELGIPVLRLMGNAGEALAEEIAARTPSGGAVLILAGLGNNGGDGYAAGASLAGRGFSVSVIDVLDGGARSEASAYYAALCRAAGIEPIALSSLEEEALDACLLHSDTVVDAILGTGARLELPEAIAALITRVNALPERILRVAADLPTGSDGDHGRVGAVTFRADVTVTFAVAKRGMYAYPARALCGEIIVHDIGLDPDAIDRAFPSDTRLLDPRLAASMLPARDRNSHKGSFGRLLILAGSRAYRGAAALASSAALRAGAGIVTLASHESVLDLALSGLPELIVMPTQELDRLDREHTAELYDVAERASAILIGPGSGTSNALCCLLWELMNKPGAPLVIDADGLNSLAMHQSESLSRLKNAKRCVLLTPHPLEFARLAGCTVADVQADRIGSLLRFTEENRVTVILKGAGTLIASPDGRLTLNPTGSPALSKAGSGDTLAGAVAALLAQSLEMHDAASLAVYLHGAAGDRLSHEYSEYGVLPSQLPAAIGREIRALEIIRDKESQT